MLNVKSVLAVSLVAMLAVAGQAFAHADVAPKADDTMIQNEQDMTGDKKAEDHQSAATPATPAKK